MKGNQYLGLYVAAVLWFLSSMYVAARDDDPCTYFSDNTNIRDPDDCSQGITCQNSKSIYSKKCSGTTPFYDKDKNTCVKTLADQSMCDISCTNSTGKFVADPKSCFGYYYCQDEDWARYGHCPDSTHFDVTTQSCIYSSVSECNVTSLNFCAIVKDGVYFNDPSSCEKYFTCKKGNLTPVSCKKDLYYQTATGKCVQKSLVPCAAHPYPADVCGTQKKPKANVFVKDGATCRGFFYCAAVSGGFDTSPVWGQCPKNTFFDEANQSCADPLTVACTADRCEGRDMTFVSSGKKGCRHYLRCQNDIQLEELSCGNYFFDEVAGVCTSTIISYKSCS